MRTLVFDLESDGLLSEATRIHVLCIQDTTQESVEVYHNSDEFVRDGTLMDGMSRLHWADRLVCHNAIGFDIPLIKKIYGKEMVGNFHYRIHDTFILSQMLFANEVNRHGLANWGRRLGIEKPGHEDWSKLSQEMIHRCIEDVRINARLFQICEKVGWNTDSLYLEQRLYRNFCEHQVGVGINVSRITRLIDRLQRCVDIIHREVKETLGLRTASEAPYATIFKKDGSHTSNVIKWAQESQINPDSISGVFSRVTFEPVNIGSSKQLGEALLRLGWKPDTMTPGGTPQIAGSKFNGISGQLGVLLRKRNIYSHKKKQLAGILKNTENGLCPTPALVSGTNTGRFRHRLVCNIPK